MNKVKHPSIVKNHGLTKATCDLKLTVFQVSSKSQLRG